MTNGKNIRALGSNPDDATTAAAVNSVGDTVGTFLNRINRKLNEQKVQKTESQKLADERQARLLQAMTTIRRALSETCKINLGDRFQFDLVVTDWDGWPRLELQLLDALRPSLVDVNLIVTAHDRDETGTVIIGTNSGKSLGSLGLAEPREVEKIPLVLKKAVRDFLDIAGHHVLNPPPAEELFNPSFDEVEEDPKNQQINKQLGGASLFSEHYDISTENVIKPDGPAATPKAHLDAQLFDDHHVAAPSENRVMQTEDHEPIELLITSAHLRNPRGK